MALELERVDLGRRTSFSSGLLENLLERKEEICNLAEEWLWSRGFLVLCKVLHDPRELFLGIGPLELQWLDLEGGILKEFLRKSDGKKGNFRRGEFFKRKREKGIASYRDGGIKVILLGISSLMEGKLSPNKIQSILQLSHLHLQRLEINLPRLWDHWKQGLEGLKGLWVMCIERFGEEMKQRSPIVGGSGGREVGKGVEFESKGSATEGGSVHVVSNGENDLQEIKFSFLILIWFE